MAIQQEGMVIQGGQVRIAFPNMDITMSIDNETEMASAIEMMKKALELHEIEVAKVLLVQEIEQKEFNKRKSQVQIHPPVPPFPNPRRANTELCYPDEPRGLMAGRSRI